jgi:thioredoxin 1
MAGGNLKLKVSDIKHFDESDFQASVLDSQKPVVVDFYADWCGPCRMMAPVILQLAGEYGDRLMFGKLDTDANPGIAMRYQVMGIPTLGLFKGGQMVDRLVGYPGPTGVRSWLDRAIERTAAA